MIGIRILFQNEASKPSGGNFFILGQAVPPGSVFSGQGFIASLAFPLKPCNEGIRIIQIQITFLLCKNRLNLYICFRHFKGIGIPFFCSGFVFNLALFRCHGYGNNRIALFCQNSKFNGIAMLCTLFFQYYATALITDSR